MIPFSIALLAGCHQRGGGSFTPFATVSQLRPLSGDVEQLVVTARVGDVVVSPSPGAEMRIEAEVRVRIDRVRMDRGDLEKAGKAFKDHVRVSERDGVLTIEDAHRDEPDREDWSVTLRVAAPREMSVRAATGVGNVDVQTAAGEVKAQTGVGNARVTAGELAGVSVTSGTGNVNVAAGRVGGDLEALSGVGNVTAKVAGVEGKTRVKTGTGNVEVVFTGVAPRGDVSARCGVGNVQVRLPAGAAGKFSAETGVGNLSVGGLAGVTVSRSVMGASASGTVGDGEPHYSISTGTGNVAVRADE